MPPATTAVRRATRWVATHRIESGFLVGTFAAAAFLRFYRVTAYLPFGGDEGRDAMVVRDFLVGHHPPWLGPGTSVGAMHLGPFYYYLMAVPMAIDWLNPVAAAVGVGIISLASLGLVYYLTRQWFGWTAAVVATALYAVSRIVVTFGRASVNAHPAPFFALLAVFGLERIRRTADFRWLALVGGALGALVQMHLLALGFVPVALVAGAVLWHTTRRPRHRGLGVLAGLATFTLVLAPYWWYELTHHLENTRAGWAFVTGGSGPSLLPGSFPARVWDVGVNQLVGNHLTGNVTWLAILTAGLAVVALGYGLFRPTTRWASGLLLGWLAAGVLGVALIRQPISAHYLEFVNPVPFIALGAAGALILTIRPPWRWIAGAAGILLAGWLVWLNLVREPFVLTPPPEAYQRESAVARHIADTTGPGQFIFIEAATDYDTAYRFLLVRSDYPAAAAGVPASTLVVVCDVPHPCTASNDPRLAGWRLVRTDVVSGTPVLEFSRE